MSIPTFKVIVIGDTNTGKTSIIHQYTRKNFPEAHFTTPLPIEHSKNVNNKCNLDIWDTAGAEEWQSMNSSVYHGSNAVIYLSSYDNQKSLNDLKDVWFPMVNRYLGTDDVPSFLAVNKEDLDEDQKYIESDQIEQMKNEIKACEWMSVSAKENKNVDELFETVANKLAERAPAPSPQSVNVANTENTGDSGKKGGCGC